MPSPARCEQVCFLRSRISNLEVRVLPIVDRAEGSFAAVVIGLLLNADARLHSWKSLLVA